MPDAASAPTSVPRFNRLALKTAALTAAATTAVALAALLLAPPWVAVPLVGLAAGVAAYAAFHTLIARRLELARATLRQARKRRFDALSGLREAETRDELDELLWQVYRAGRVLQQEIERLERLESGELRMTLAPFPLGPLADEAAEALETVAEAKGVTLIQRLPPDLPLAAGDRDQLRQVLVNLIDNAIKYNNPGGRIEIAARVTGEGTVRVAVTDDGIGIPAEEVPRLTERFYRVDRSRSRAQGGTGLGLAIVKHILEAHGQRLRIESRPGYGSSFAFELPTGEGKAGTA